MLCYVRLAGQCLDERYQERSLAQTERDESGQYVGMDKDTPELLEPLVGR